MSGDFASDSKGLADDLDEWGLTPQQQQQLIDKTGGQNEDFYLWPQHQKAWNAFLTIKTQSRNTGGAFAGFSYEGVNAGLKMAGIEITPDLFQSLRDIESIILEFVRNNGK